MRKANSTHGFNHSRRIRSLPCVRKKHHSSTLRFLKVREMRQKHPSWANKPRYRFHPPQHGCQVQVACLLHYLTGKLSKFHQLVTSNMISLSLFPVGSSFPKKMGIKILLSPLGWMSRMHTEDGIYGLKTAVSACTWLTNGLKTH